MKTFFKVVEAILAVIGGIMTLCVGVLVAVEGPKRTLTFGRNMSDIIDNYESYDALFSSKRPIDIKVE